MFHQEPLFYSEWPIVKDMHLKQENKIRSEIKTKSARFQRVKTF